MNTIESQKKIDVYRSKFLKVSSQINEMVISHILEKEEREDTQYTVSYEVSYSGELIELRVFDILKGEFVEAKQLWNISKIFKVTSIWNPVEENIEKMEKSISVLLDMKKVVVHYIRLNNSKKSRTNVK